MKRQLARRSARRVQIPSPRSAHRHTAALALVRLPGRLGVRRHGLRRKAIGGGGGSGQAGGAAGKTQSCVGAGGSSAIGGGPACRGRAGEGSGGVGEAALAVPCRLRSPGPRTPPLNCTHVLASPRSCCSWRPRSPEARRRLRAACSAARMFAARAEIGWEACIDAGWAKGARVRCGV